MDNLQQLATNALLDHWPPHLGVQTDAEKIAYLAAALKEANLAANNYDALDAENEELHLRIIGLQETVAKLRDRVKELEAKIK